MDARWKILWNDGSIYESKSIIYFVELANDKIPPEFQDTEEAGANELKNVLTYHIDSLNSEVREFFQNQQKPFKSFKFDKGILSIEKFEHGTSNTSK